MVTIINTNTSIRSTLDYNENKIKTGAAQCIAAANFPVDLHHISYEIKLKRFMTRTMLNPRALHSTVHIIVSFSPSDNLSKEQLVTITHAYMEKIGFGKQPYLVYQHFDSSQPHLHVVTINIERNSKRIDMFQLARKKSEPARKELEELFGLVKAEGRKNYEEFGLNSLSPTKIRYGKMESKKAINHVLHHVLTQYKYTNLSELNAVLGQYNLKAYITPENIKACFSNRLYFSILTEQKKPIGTPIKGRDLLNKPSLPFLESQFEVNVQASIQTKARLKKNVEITLFTSLSLSDLIRTLNKQGINTVLQTNSKGDIDQITYIDLKTKSIYNDDILKTLYNTNLLQENTVLNTSTKNQGINSLRKQPRATVLRY